MPLGLDPVGTRNAGRESPQVHRVTTDQAPPRQTSVPQASEDLSDFATVYRANVAGITAFFARRGLDPQTVADLTSETFVEAIGSRTSYDPRIGPPRPWLFAIARAVYARHCERSARGDRSLERLGGQLELDEDEIEELAARIDTQRDAAQILERLTLLRELERQAIELVDLDGLSPKEAAASLGVSAGALRVRLFRARTKLRKEGKLDESS